MILRAVIREKDEAEEGIEMPLNANREADAVCVCVFF